MRNLQDVVFIVMAPVYSSEAGLGTCRKRHPWTVATPLRRFEKSPAPLLLLCYLISRNASFKQKLCKWQKENIQQPVFAGRHRPNY